MTKYSADELFKIAFNHLQKKEFRKSSHLFEKLLKDYPDNLSILRNLSHSYAFSGDYKKAEECIKKTIEIKPNDPFAYQFLASVLKSQDKIDEIIKIIKEILEKKLINKKWELQKKILAPLIARDKKEIDDYRKKISKGLDDIINSNKELNYDNDQIISPPLFELTYTDEDNKKINEKMVRAFKKIYQPLNYKISINEKLNNKIKIGFISQFFTDHTIGKLFKNLIFSLDLKFFDIVIIIQTKQKRVKYLRNFREKIRLGLKMKFYQTNYQIKSKSLKKKNLIFFFIQI